MGKKKSVIIPPGANWLALKPSLASKGPAKGKKSAKSAPRPSSAALPRGPTPSRISPSPSPETVKVSTSTRIPVSNEFLQLRDMVLGKGPAAERPMTNPGRYLALDCEMVGVGEDGSESSLARASIVDFHGRVVLDEFVQQRERVFDYRTKVSGIRPQDLVKAKPFNEVQAKIADLLAPPDQILVGHALSNDLKALLLSHPASRRRDTQRYAAKRPPPSKLKGNDANTPTTKAKLTLWEKYRSPRIGLKRLTKEELGVDIQGGEHSSVTDARAAMATFRLHKRAWDASLPVSHVKPPVPVLKHDSDVAGDTDRAKNTLLPSKRKCPPSEVESPPGGGRRGVSSGLSTVVRERTRKGSAVRSKSATKTPDGLRSHAPEVKWWERLGEGNEGGSKGRLYVS